ncbi:LuxR C-terminal-related transcriptional regulator [Pseudonocardia sp. TRM90224]|uniref:LuxR C-terminal-related transcriptional regulator n=1 Tax=Pseudonocardia sp. TRM90224 TaxID=2812678 RepID=UPI001E49F868|nr:LuxR C-terminal-related transcriptional regulator [Pseudonocardia sp. TRM90224]
MARSAAARQAEHDIVRACHSGLDPDRLRHTVLRSLRRVMTIDAAFFATADPETLLFTGGHAEDPLGTATARFLHNETGGADVNTFTALAKAATHVASLDGATRHDRPTSERYREIMRPLGLGDELRAALVAGSDCWGYLCLHREDVEHGFTRAEVDVVARIGPHVAHALRQAALLHPTPSGGDPPRPGVVLLDDRLDVVASTPEADAVLSLIDHHDSTSLPLPVAVYAVAAALMKVEEIDPAAVAALPSARVPSKVGSWITVSASRLQGDGERRIAVVVEVAEPRSALGIRLAAHGLSAREQDVARLVLRGEPTRTISDTLHISTHTVQDHLKSVFDKVGVRSRRDLVAMMLGAHGR